MSWPERGPDIYHPVSGLSPEQLAENWTDDRGTFLLKTGMQWVARYYYYQKIG
jgi:hypothetical protein